MAIFVQHCLVDMRTQRERALTCTKKDIACSWVPCDDAHTLGVAFQYHHRLRHGSHKAILRNLPDLWRT